MLLQLRPPHRLAAAVGGKATQHVSAAIASLLALSSGMSLGWTSAASSVERGAQGFALTAEEWSWVGAALTLGAVAGCLVVGALLRPLGARDECLGLAPLFCIGWALHLWATDVWMLAAGRALVGLCFGATCVVVPIFTSEIGESAVRGALGAYLELNVCLGVLFVYLLGAYLPLAALNACCLAVPGAFALLFVWLPASPRWLLAQGEGRAAARSSLAFYRGADPGPIGSALTDAELAALEATVKGHSKEEEASLVAAFATRPARRGLLLSVIAMMLQQLSGIDGVTFYASQLFRDAGTLSLTADEASMVMAGAQIVFAAVALLLVDRLGRKVLLMSSAGVMGVCCVAMGFFFYLNSGADRDRSLDWVPVLVSSLYVMGFAFGLGPVPWLFVAEIFPNRVKGVASAVANVSNWLCAFVVTKFYPTVNESLGVHVSFWGFGAFCLAGVVAVALLFPETKGRSLDEIQDELAGARRQRKADDAERPSYGSIEDASTT